MLGTTGVCDESKAAERKAAKTNGDPQVAVRMWRSDAPDYSNGTSSNATMLMILINGFTAGPAVSL